MRIGVFNLYPFRPHVDSLRYMIDEMESNGHMVYVFSCFNRTKHCYYKGIYGESIKSCIQCNLGQIELAIRKGTYRKKAIIEDFVALPGAVESSYATLNRFETTDQIRDFISGHQEEYNDYLKGISISYASFKDFLKVNGIELVVGFNGRIDHTKAYFKACEDLSIPFVSYEYSWFGNGIMMIPNRDCLSLDIWRHANKEFSVKPLSVKQTLLAAKYAARRIGKEMHAEWRDYSGLSSFADDVEMEVLILPSSRNEFEGHEDYVSQWGHSTIGFSHVLNELGVDRSKVYLQLHPIWFQKIYGVNGESIISVYKDWASREGINVLSSEQTYESKDLIGRCKILLVNGSSASFEGGLMGKPIINVEANRFVESGVTIDIPNSDCLSELSSKLEAFDPLETRRRTLRFFYTIMFRIIHFEDKVINIGKPTEFRYIKNLGEGLERILDAAQNREFCFADESFEEGNITFEDGVIEAILSGQFPSESLTTNSVSYKNWVNRLRDLLPKGDLLD